MNSGYRTFAEEFAECCGQSCGRLAYEKNQTDGAYTEALKECKILYDEIKEQLGENGSIVNRFDAFKNHIFSLEDRYVYQQGFQDCVYLLRWIGIL